MDFLYSQVIIFLLIFLRMSGILFLTPFFSSNSINQRIKLGLLFSSAIILFPIVQVNRNIFDGLTFSIFMIMSIREIFLGLIMGFFLLLVFTVVQVAAQVYSMDMGFGVVNVFDPVSQFQIPILGQFKYLFLTAIFLACGIHRIVLKILMETFQKYPLAELTYNTVNLSKGMTDAFTYYFMLAIKLALPILGVLFIIDITLGVMARIAPQMNVFFIGMPLKIMVGFLVLIIFAPYLINFFQIMLETGVIRLEEMLEGTFGS